MLASIVRALIRKRFIVLVLTLILVIFGIHAAQDLSVDAFPDVTGVQVQIATEALGRSPEEIERLITIPLEIAMTGLLGLEEMRSLNKSGLSIITLVFTDNTDIFFARQLVMERMLSATADMPPGITPVLGPISTGLGEVYQYTLDHPDDNKRTLTIEELTDRRIIQDWVVRPLLRSIPGVAEINSQGGYIKQYHVIVDPDQLHHYNLTLQQVEQAIADNNFNSSGGILPLDTEQYLVRGVGLIQTPQDIGNIVLDEQSGIPTFVHDVAEVKIGTDTRYGAIIKNGDTESVSGIILMVRGGNAKEIVGKIKTRVAEINKHNVLPGGLQIVPYYDRTELVDTALWTVNRALIEAVFLVVVVLFVFLGDIRSSLIVVATLVITPLVTFILMNYQGISADLMSLAGLTIAIGLIADSTVVVVEHTFQRLGRTSTTNISHMRTIISAVAEIGVPVIFGICIIILVFLPLMTLQGIEGKLFSPLAFTIAIAMAISLILSLTLSPVLCSYILKRKVEQETFAITVLKSAYLRVLNKALHNEKKTIAIAVSLLLLSFLLFPFLGKSFIPTLIEGTLTPQINRVASISLSEAVEMEFEAHRLILGVVGVKSVVSKLGRGESPVDPAGQNESDPIVTLDPDTHRSQHEINNDIRQILETLPGVQIVSSQPIAEHVDEMLTTNGIRSQIEIKIFGDDLQILREISEDVAHILKSIPGSRDINIERLSGQQSLSIDIDRNAVARHGINVSDVNKLISTAIGGKEITSLYEGERRFAITLRFPEQFRNNIKAIRNLLLYNSDGAVVPLHAVARIRIVDGPTQVSRESAKRRVIVGSNLEGRDLGGFVTEIQKSLAAEIKLPPRYYYEWGGQFGNMENAMETLSIIVPIMVALMFFLLFLLFNSIRLAALTILILPFASIGGVIALFLTGEYLSVPTSVGFIALWGIAVLNGVVLLTYIQKLRNDGISLSESVIRGCQQRFRPVIMTATIAGLGFVPFLFATGPGSELHRPLAIVVIGGLITSTLLTLVVLPTLYRWFDKKPV